MGTYISQFNLATLLLNTDLVAGLRGTTPNQTDYKFPIIGIGDSLGSPIIAWTQGAGTMLSPNINSINFQNNVAGSAPIISTLSSGLTPDTSVNLDVGGFGPLGYVQFTGTNAIAIPAGTAAQAPVTFVGGGIRYNTTSQYLDYWSTVSNSWVDLTTGSALSNLTFVTNTNETAFAPNSQALSLLSTGIAYVTTTTGIIGTRTLTGTANEITVGNGTGSAGNPTFSIPSIFIAPGTAAAVTSMSAPAYLLTGASSGTISILPQAAAGTYNFNLPIIAGISGYVLTSGGGGAAPMTWTNLGSATVTSIAGTANEITASASTGAVTLSLSSTLIAPGTLAAVTSISGPEYLLIGSGSGTISILPQAAAGTYNFNMPTTAGSSGYILTSAGGGGAPMTWTDPASIGGVTSVTGTTNEITASPTTGAVVLTIPSTFIAPGTVESTGLLTSLAGLTSTGAAINLGADSRDDAINIGTGASSGRTTTIGNTTLATGIVMNVGTGEFALNGVGASTYTVGAATTTGTITIGGTAQTGTITLGASSGTNIVAIGSGTGATTVNIAAGATNAKAVNIGTGAVANVVTIGSTTGAASLTLNSGSAGITATGVSGVSVSNAAYVTINTSTGALGSVAIPGGGGSANTLSVTQVAHGFTVGQVVYYNGSAYALAEATTAALAEAIGVVSTVTSSSVFIITTSGYISSSAGLSGLTAGDVYWLSDATAGLLTLTEPTTPGHIQKPIFVTDSTASGFVINYRGEVIPASTSQWIDQSTSPVTLVANTNYVADDASLLTFNMPATVAQGSVFNVAGLGAGGWLVQMNTGQTGHLNSTPTSSGGSFASTNRYNCIQILCVTANTTFVVISNEGAITIA